MEIKGNTSYLNNNKDFKTIKGLFDENAKLSSKNIISTTAPACWENKYFEIKIETDDGTRVTFLCDVPNKPLESGTPETACYVPEEQLNKMLDTNIFDLIKEDKFQGAYIDKDNDGNPELSFGGYSCVADERGFYSANKIVVDENSNGNPEYQVNFNYTELNNGYNITFRNEQFDKDDNGVINTYNEYNFDGTIVMQELYDDSIPGQTIEYSEWYDNGQLSYKEVDTNKDGTKDLYQSWDEDGQLLSKLEYKYDENGKITLQYTGADNNIDDRINDASWAFTEDENLVKEMYDNDGNGTWDQIAEHSWSEKHGVKIRETLYDEDGDGIFETYGKLKIKEYDDRTEKTYSYRPATIDGYLDNIKGFFSNLFK